MISKLDKLFPTLMLRSSLHRDVDKMAQVADTAPIFIDAGEDSWIPGGPIGGQTNLSIRNEHMQYIITWSVLHLIFFVNVIWDFFWNKHLKIACPFSGFL